MIPTGKFHLLTAANGCLKLINYEKTDHESGTCPGRRQKLRKQNPYAVSYTHLTLPTIYSV